MKKTQFTEVLRDNGVGRKATDIARYLGVDSPLRYYLPRPPVEYVVDRVQPRDH
ncbi:hypothetical protein [Lewinella sp. IMCC34183]|uniref:hypothetical protein n=1 Tax=Lewinella sp. IMCC34183 TaxID=2248762 RepID=UPI0013007161|nr:hypothetical protein [Lewinella sp. IMCC34183]